MKLYLCSVSLSWRTAVAQWLRRCATNRKVDGSIQDGVIRIGSQFGPESNRPLTEMCIRSICWG